MNNIIAINCLNNELHIRVQSEHNSYISIHSFLFKRCIVRRFTVTRTIRYLIISRRYSLVAWLSHSFGFDSLILS